MSVLTSRHASHRTARIVAGRPLARAVRIAVPTVLVAAFLPAVMATTAHADEAINPSLSVEAATVVDMDGNPIPVSEDPGAPAGDGQNAADAQAPSGEAEGGAIGSNDLSHALGSKQSQDMKGYEPSLYQGKWFMPKRKSDVAASWTESPTTCIAQ